MSKVELSLVVCPQVLPEHAGGHVWAWRMALDALFMDVQTAGVGRLQCVLGLLGAADGLRDRAALSLAKGQGVAGAWLGVPPDADGWDPMDRVYVLQYRRHFWAPRPAHDTTWHLEWERAIYLPAARALGAGMWLAGRLGAAPWQDGFFRALPRHFAAARGPAHYTVQVWAPGERRS